MSATRTLLGVLLAGLAACGGSEPPPETPARTPRGPTFTRELKEAAGAPGRALSESVVWHDGDRTRRAWLDPEGLVELRPDEASRALLRSLAPEAEERSTSAGARRWRLRSGGLGARTLARRLRQAGASSRFAPAFHDAASDDARTRAPTGRILVKLPDEWTEERAEAWIAATGLEPAGRLRIGRHVVVLEVGGGMEAIERANALHEAGEVVWATPEWWTGVGTR